MRQHVRKQQASTRRKRLGCHFHVDGGDRRWRSNQFERNLDRSPRYEGPTLGVITWELDLDVHDNVPLVQTPRSEFPIMTADLQQRILVSATHTRQRWSPDRKISPDGRNFDR